MTLDELAIIVERELEVEGYHPIGESRLLFRVRFPGADTKDHRRSGVLTSASGTGAPPNMPPAATTVSSWSASC